MPDVQDSDFRIGDQVQIRSGIALCRVWAGQLGQVVSLTATLPGRLLIELETGERLSFKPEHLDKIDRAADSDQSDGSDSDSGDSLPPLEFIQTAEVENQPPIEPGDFVQLVDLKMSELNGHQGYVLRLTPAIGHKEERVEVKMLSDGKLLSVKRSNVCGCAESPKARRRTARGRGRGAGRLQKGDEVILQGLTKAVEYNGQRALVAECPADGSSGRVTVALLRTGQRISLQQDKLRPSVTFEDEDSEDDFSDLPPLRCIRPKVASKFQIGQKLWLHMVSKPDYHGQQVFVLPTDPSKLSAGVCTVQLPNGKRILTKESNLKDEAP